MGRDLLYKPPTPVLPTEDEPPKKRVDKLGQPPRARDLGEAGAERRPSAAAVSAAAATAPRAKAPPPAALAAAGPGPGPGPAHQAAYFTKDVVATMAVNPRARPQRALRGSDEVTDLRKVVLPPGAVQSPAPNVLFAASERMSLQAAERPGLAEVMARLGSDAQAEGMSVEKLQQRMALLETMTQARVMALARMAQLPPNRVQRSVCADHALSVQGSGLEQAGDLEADGEMLAERIAAGSTGMRRRMAKALGLRLPG